MARGVNRGWARVGFLRPRTIRALVGVFVLQLAAAGHAVMDRFVEGTHYKALPVAVPTDVEPGQVEVVEVFSYMCIHCFSFDPTVEAWSNEQPEDVVFRRVPAIFNSQWALLAQAYYAADVLGVGEEMHGPLFRAIHEDRTDIRRPELMAQLFADHANVSEADFVTAFDSFMVRSRVQQASSRGQQYRVSGVPAMVVAGKYLVDGKMAGGNLQMLQVVDHLVDLERSTAAQTEAAQDSVEDAAESGSGS